MFRALADPTRRAIFESLVRRGGDGVAVKDVASHAAVSQPAVSQHLAALRDAGLVSGRRRGRCVYYRAEPRGIRPLTDWIAHYRAFWARRLERLENLLESMDP